MWGLIVVLGLVAVVILVGVLVALGMRASRAGDDDDWMSDDEQPRGRRAGRSRGRRARGDDPDDEPYGGDMRVAGGTMAGQAPHRQLPAAPMAGSGPAPLPAAGSAPVPERPSEEMDDDEYWSTITFDKPKFPWRQDKEQPAAPRGQDPLGPAEPIQPVAPTRVQDAVPPAPAPHLPGHGAPQGPPVDSPAPPTTPQPAVMGDPLDAPLAPSIPNTLEVPSRHAGEAEPTTTTPAYGSADQSGGFSYGGDAPSPYGDDPLNTGERPSYGSLPPVPPSAPAPSAGSPPLGTPTAGPAGDDPLKLPSVDELLAKIQSDRQRSAAEPSGPAGGFDPLKDPLDTGERSSYGSSSSSLGGWSPSDSSSSYGSSSSSDYGTSSSSSSDYGASSSPDFGSSSDSPYGADPLSGGYSSTSGYGSSSYDSGAYSSSGTSGYSSGDTSYGSGSPLGDDPLGGGYTPSSSDYGSYGGEGSSGGYSSGGYPASGSSSYGSGYYGSSGTNGYGAGSSGGRGADDADKTQAYPTSPYGSSYGSKKTEEKRSDEWGSYGDYRS